MNGPLKKWRDIYCIMKLQETFKKILMEEISGKFKRRFPIEDFDSQFLDSFDTFYNMMKKTKPDDLPRRQFLDDLIDGVITNFIIKMQLKSQSDSNEMFYDELMPEMQKLLRPKIIKLFIERENI